MESRKRANLANDDRGAVIIIVGVAMVAIFGVTALAVDLGNAWQNRRELTNATDAGALAAAGVFAVGGDGCVEAAAYMAVNDGDAAPEGEAWCTHAGSGSYGVVAVRAQKTVDYAFAPVIGNDSVTIEAETRAAYGQPSLIDGGLRPFGLCLDAMNEFPAWTLPLTASTGVLRVPYGKDDQPEACNGDENIPGNWGLMDFNGGSNPIGDTRKWILEGYDGPVYAGTRFVLCDNEPEACIDGDPGAWSNSLSSQLNYLIDNDVTFTLPIFDSGGGNGNNGYFHIVGFVRAKLHGYKANGSAHSRYFDMEFLPGIGQGQIGSGTAGIDTGLRVIEMCGVETASSC